MHFTLGLVKTDSSYSARQDIFHCIRVSFYKLFGAEFFLSKIWNKNFTIINKISYQNWFRADNPEAVCILVPLTSPTATFSLKKKKKSGEQQNCSYTIDTKAS